MRSRFVIFLAPGLLLLAACGNAVGVTSGHASMSMASEDADRDTTDDFDVTVDQTNTPTVVPSANGSIAPVDIKYVISIRNRTRNPVRVTRVVLGSVSGSRAEVPFTTRKFDRRIAPDATEKLEFWSSMDVSDPQLGARAPMLVRTTITFDQAGAQRQESFTRRVNGRVAIGIS